MSVWLSGLATFFRETVAKTVMKSHITWPAVLWDDSHMLMSTVSDDAPLLNRHGIRPDPRRLRDRLTDDWRTNVVMASICWFVSNGFSDYRSTRKGCEFSSNIQLPIIRLPLHIQRQQLKRPVSADIVRFISCFRYGWPLYTLLQR